MFNISHSLMIKYGLASDPSEHLVEKWIKRTEELIDQGYDAETAGRKAAQEIFSDYGRYKYAAEADTIISLLQQAKKR